MSRKFKLIALITIIILQICILFLKKKEIKDNSHEQIISYFQKNISYKEKLALSLIKDKTITAKKNLDKDNITVIEYNNDSLIYWSNNQVSILENTKQIIDSINYIKIGNAWYIIKKRDNLYALILIAKDYQQSNKYLRNEFAQGLNKFPNIKISADTNKYTDIIFDTNEKPILSINTDNCEYKNSYLLLSIIILQLLLILAIATRIVINSEKRYYLALLAVFLAALRYSIILLAPENSVFNIEPLNTLFTQWYHLSYLLLDSILISSFFITYKISKANYFTNFNKHNEILSVISIGMILSFSICYFVINILQKIITNTDISLELSKWEKVDLSSFLIFISISFIIYSLSFGARKFLIDLSTKITFKKLVVSSIAIIIFFSAFINKLTDYSIYPSLLVFIIFLANILSIKFNKTEISRIIFIIHLFLISICIVVFINTGIEKKIINEQKSFAQELFVEEDIETENILPELSKKIDSLLQTDSEHLGDKIYNLSDSLLGKTYYISITQCNSRDLISIGENEYSCLEFFNSKLQKSKQVKKSKFKSIDKFDGLTSFIGSFKKSDELFYIEFFSKTRNEGIGYPQILDYSNFKNKNNFSWAKYSNNKLIISSGQYNFTNQLINTKDSLYKEKQNYIYNLRKGENNIMVVSNQKILPNKILNTPYLFILLCLISIAPWIYNTLKNKEKQNHSFSKRIRNCFIICLLVFFLIIGGASIYYNINRFQNKQEERISTLVKTLTRKLENTELSTASLSNISDVLQTDINIYSSHGHLLYTSRPSIFDKDIISELINREALDKIKTKKEAIIFNKESVNQLSYLSVYTPLVNKYHNEQLYINIPYFEESSLLRDEILNQLISGLNIYIFISFLAIIIAAFLAEKITKPLQLILTHFRKIELSKENKTIDYNQNDELGLLVKEYNKMAIKLGESAKELAQSERETAWREMAKQIAHEIKNPLTPMKLNLQHLIHTKDFESEKWNNQFNKTCQTLLEQIDNLANIASSFADFSNIASTKSDVIDIVKLIEGVKDLFSDKDNNISIICEEENLSVFAPINQIKRAIINIVKNSLHSMQALENKELKIYIEKTKDNSLLISFKDQGIGINEEIRHQIFEPHFTTKSSGMGLGLAITKEIILNAKGSIWFETEKGKGTTFFIKLPLYN